MFRFLFHRTTNKNKKKNGKKCKRIFSVCWYVFQSDIRMVLNATKALQSLFSHTYSIPPKDTSCGSFVMASVPSAWNADSLLNIHPIMMRFEPTTWCSQHSICQSGHSDNCAIRRWRAATLPKQMNESPNKMILMPFNS